MTIPLLPPDTFIAYSNAIGLAAPKMEQGARAELPQIYADMFGWRELAAEVARVWDALPEDERARAVIVGQNYGEAGAIDYFGPTLGLPHAVSPHNGYWLWGPGDWDGRWVVIGEMQDRPLFAASRSSATAAAHSQPYEREL
jgi:hypothetical protein